MKKTIKYTKQMCQYLAWQLFQETFGAMEWVKKEAGMIDGLVEEARNQLTDDQIKIVENRAQRIRNDYEKLALENLKQRYWHDDEEEDDDFIFPEVNFNEQFYEIWKEGVAKRQTVKMKYDSTTSGVSERLVDPYKSRAPYGEGYCHNRREVRKFRFDKVFEKPNRSSKN